jgi:hypothetical protein
MTRLQDEIVRLNRKEEELRNQYHDSQKQCITVRSERDDAEYQHSTAMTAIKLRLTRPDGARTSFIALRLS